MDIIVTTPVSQMASAAQEAKDCIARGVGTYFRRLGYFRNGKLCGFPRHLNAGDRVWYTEAGFVRGYCLVRETRVVEEQVVCQTTGRVYEPGFYVWMSASSWVWVKPVPYRGFQGWRYQQQGLSPVPVGGWLDPRPWLVEPASIGDY